MTEELSDRQKEIIDVSLHLIAESGIVRDDDVAYLADCGVSGSLIGRAFIEHENPKALAAHWKQVYKEAAK